MFIRILLSIIKLVYTLDAVVIYYGYPAWFESSFAAVFSISLPPTQSV